MVTKQRIWIAAGVAAAAVAAVLAFALTGGTRSVELPQQAVTGETHLSRLGTLFADPLRASVQVLVDRHRVDPNRIGFTTTFDPYVRVGDARVTRHDTGPVTQLVYSTELICLTNTCLAAHSGDSLRVQFPPAEVFYMLRHGSITLETYVPGRGPITIETLGAGEVVGWSWLFPPNRWHFDARALSLVRAVEFDTACLREKLEEDSALGYDLMSRFAQVLQQRLRWTRMRLLDVYGDVLAG